MSAARNAIRAHRPAPGRLVDNGEAPGDDDEEMRETTHVFHDVGESASLVRGHETRHGSRGARDLLKLSDGAVQQLDGQRNKRARSGADRWERRQKEEENGALKFGTANQSRNRIENCTRQGLSACVIQSSDELALKATVSPFVWPSPPGTGTAASITFVRPRDGCVVRIALLEQLRRQGVISQSEALHTTITSR